MTLEELLIKYKVKTIEELDELLKKQNKRRNGTVIVTDSSPKPKIKIND